MSLMLSWTKASRVSVCVFFVKMWMLGGQLLLSKMIKQSISSWISDRKASSGESSNFGLKLDQEAAEGRRHQAVTVWNNCCWLPNCRWKCTLQLSSNRERPSLKNYVPIYCHTKNGFISSHVAAFEQLLYTKKIKQKKNIYMAEKNCF